MVSAIGDAFRAIGWSSEMEKHPADLKVASTLAEPFGIGNTRTGVIWLDIDWLANLCPTATRILNAIGLIPETDVSRSDEDETLVEPTDRPYRGRPVLRFYEPIVPIAPEEKKVPAATMPTSSLSRSRLSRYFRTEDDDPEKDLERLKEIAGLKGYKIIGTDGEFPLGGRPCDGCKYPDGRIYLNKQLPKYRQAAVLAHEIEEDVSKPHTLDVYRRAICLLKSIEAAPSVLGEAVEDLYRFQSLRN